MKYKWLILFTQVLCVVCFAQTKPIDSLKKILPSAKDTQQINILNEISELYFQLPGYVNANYISAGEYANKALQLSKQIQYPKGAGIALFNYGNVLSQSSYKGEDIQGAIIIFNNAISFLKESNENKLLGNCFELLADCTHELGNNEQAIHYYDSSLIQFQKIKDTSGIILSLEWKGHSYFDLGDYKNAYLYGQQALTLAQITNDTVAQVHATTHLANIFLGAGMPETVLKYMRIITLFYPNIYKTKEFASWEIWWGLLKSGEAYLQIGDIDSATLVAQTTGFNPDDVDTDMFLGRLFNAKHQYNKALFYFKDGFQRSERTAHTISLARHANGVGQAYLALGNYDSALYYANKAVQAAQNIHALLEWKNAISTLTDIYDKTNNYTKAYHFSQLYKSLSDSLAPEQYKRKLALIEIQQDLENQKQQAQLLSKENQISQQQIKIQQSSLKRKSLLLYIFFTALLVVVLLGMLVGRNIKLKRRKEQLQQLMAEANAQLEQHRKEQEITELHKEKTELEMQALRAQMNPHFIFNSLNSINRFILQNNRAEASEYLTKFSKLVRMILQNSQASFITLESELESLTLYLEMEALRFNYHFDFKISFPDDLDISVLKVPPLIIQPYAENAIWHGLMHKEEKGQLDIEVSQENNYLFFKITNDGIGRRRAAEFASKSATNHKSMGLRITADRIAMMQNTNGGSPVTINDLVNADGSVAGTEVVIKIPVIYTS